MVSRGSCEGDWDPKHRIVSVSATNWAGGVVTFTKQCGDHAC